MQFKGGLEKMIFNGNTTVPAVELMAAYFRGVFVSSNVTTELPFDDKLSLNNTGSQYAKEVLLKDSNTADFEISNKNDVIKFKFLLYIPNI